MFFQPKRLQEQNLYPESLAPTSRQETLPLPLRVPVLDAATSIASDPAWYHLWLGFRKCLGDKSATLISDNG